MALVSVSTTTTASTTLTTTTILRKVQVTSWLQPKQQQQHQHQHQQQKIRWLTMLRGIQIGVGIWVCIYVTNIYISYSTIVEYDTNERIDPRSTTSTGSSSSNDKIDNEFNMMNNNTNKKQKHVSIPTSTFSHVLTWKEKRTIRNQQQQQLRQLHNQHKQDHRNLMLNGDPSSIVNNGFDENNMKKNNEYNNRNKKINVQEENYLGQQLSYKNNNISNTKHITGSSSSSSSSSSNNTTGSMKRRRVIITIGKKKFIQLSFDNSLRYKFEQIHDPNDFDIMYQKVLFHHDDDDDDDDDNNDNNENNNVNDGTKHDSVNTSNWRNIILANRIRNSTRKKEGTNSSGLDSFHNDNHHSTYNTASQAIVDKNTTTTTTNNNNSDDYILPYDINNCPSTRPPNNYPITWNAVNIVLTNWNPDNTNTIPTTIYESLCIFDWRIPIHRTAVFVYQQAEVPFVVQYHPDIIRTSYRWLHTKYMDALLSNVQPQRTEHSTTNHFMYWNSRLVPNNNVNEVLPSAASFTTTNTSSSSFSMHRIRRRRKMKTIQHRSTKDVVNDIDKDKGNESSSSRTTHRIITNTTNSNDDDDNKNDDDEDLSQWRPPTNNVHLTYREWKEFVHNFSRSTSTTMTTDADTKQQQQQQHQRDWYYYRLNSVYPTTATYMRFQKLKEKGDCCNEFLYDELPFFDPTRAATITATTAAATSRKSDGASMELSDSSVSSSITSSSLFMVEPSEERGINCRFGMKGSIAEAHFDPTRNWIVVLKGYRRYILAHPNQCTNLELYPLKHPSGRHSKIDWSNISSMRTPSTIRGKQQQQRRRPFQNALVNEIVLQAGDALYLPTSWFHYIVSLTTNYQCNARSGVTTENNEYIRQCGFPI